MALERDGNVKASRWCAGCHDPVPFFSGAFDDPNFDVVNHPTAHAGITCTVCHAITHVNGTVGNGAYTIEAAQHYPFAFSDDSSLQWVNNQLVKAKPDFHKQTFLKPFHKTAEFCSTCHKVHLPVELNHYKDFLRGQNHYDTFLLSGVSGHGSRSFYYPPQAKTNCAVCHMPLKPSRRLRVEGLRRRPATGKRHRPPLPRRRTPGCSSCSSTSRGSSTATPRLQTGDRHDTPTSCAATPDGKDKKLRIDLFGLKDGRRATRTTTRRAAAARTAEAAAGQVVPGRGGGPHAGHRPPVHAGDGRLERDLGGLHSRPPAAR